VTPETVAILPRLVATAAVVALVVSLGLGTSFRQLLWVLERPGLLLRSVAAVVVLVPVATLLVALALGLDRQAVLGIVLMGVSPAAPLVLWRAGQARGHPSYASGIQVVLAVLAVASVPLSLAGLSLLFPASRASISPLDVAGQVGRVQLLPLAAGMALRALRPETAERLARPLARVAALLLAAFVAVVLVARGGELVRLPPRAWLAMALAVAASLGIGHLLGGPAPETRTVLAVASALRNPGLALLVVQVNFPGLGVGQVLLAYVVVTLAFLAAYAARRRRAGRAA
jgi:predicted Na+-dependent transporter